MSVGKCNLCGEERKLTFEHIPPRRAFNCNPTVAHTLEGFMLGNKLKANPIVVPFRRGLGIASLCESCNNFTGQRYGEAFWAWTAQCARYADRIGDEHGCLLPFEIQPLEVLKQVMTMAMAAGQCGNTRTMNELRQFVLTPDARICPSTVEVLTYLVPPTRDRRRPELTLNRFINSCAVMHIDSRTSFGVLSEIAFPPAGYLVVFSIEERSLAELLGLTDIGYFGRSPPREVRPLHIHLPVRRPFGPVPGYYPELRYGKPTKFLADSHLLLLNENVDRFFKR